MTVQMQGPAFLDAELEEFVTRCMEGLSHQVRGDPEPFCDQYSLGVILYEMLTGKPPFEGPPPVVLFKTLHQEPPRPRDLNPEVPKSLERICMKAMAKKARSRYLDCRELADTLTAWQSGSLHSGDSQLSEDGRTGNPRQSRVFFYTMLTGLIAATTAGIGFAVWYFHLFR